MSDRAPSHNILKCKYCDWYTLKSRTNRQGKFIGIESAQRSLVDHSRDEHPEHFEALQAWLDSDA